jgi:acetylglutamate kinase
LDQAIRKAGVLVEALGWIRRFRGRYVVIKLGGSGLEEADAVRAFLTDVIFMASVGMKPVLVHGGGKAISQAMAQAGIEPRFVHGRRYTDEPTLEIVARVLAGEICGELVDEIRRQGADAVGLSYLTENCLVGRTLTLAGPGGEAIDLGRVGEVVDVDRGPIERAVDAGAIPVIPSVAMDAEGNKLNVNADTAAAAVARFLGAEKLVFLSDVPGILRDQQDPATRISHLSASQCRKLIVEGVIDAGMVPKVEAALDALAVGVAKVHIVDAAMPHSVLLEIYSDTGVGTEIVP